VLVLAIVAIVIFMMTKKKQATDTPTDKQADTPPPPPPPPVTTTPPPPPTGAGTDGTGAGTDGTGGRSNTGTGTPTPEVVDPNSTRGKGLINHKIQSYVNDGGAMQQIKRDNKIGSRLWQGISAGKWEAYGKDSAPLEIMKNFLGGISGALDLNDYGTYGVYPSYQYPQLPTEVGKLAENKANSQRDVDGYDTNYFRWDSLGGQNPLNHWENDGRKKHLYAFENTRTFAQNYRNEMYRLDNVLYNTAIRALEAQNIYFSGINA
jgi:hypothetical protein